MRNCMINKTKERVLINALINYIHVMFLFVVLFIICCFIYCTFLLPLTKFSIIFLSLKNLINNVIRVGAKKHPSFKCSSLTFDFK